MSTPDSRTPTTGRAQLETLLGDRQSPRDFWDEFAKNLCVADNLQGFEGAPPFPTIARFEYRALLGRGGWGIVFKVRDTKLDRLVALKLCPTQTAESIEREAKMLARVSHENVVTVHEVGCHEGKVYFVMEYLAGRNARRLVKFPPPWREVIALYRDAGRGLAAAHDEKIIHSDFKPDNVVLDKHGRPKVADFGLARMIAEHRPQTDEDEERGSPYGTRGYIAPEILRGEHSDARSDQWSFCVSVWETIDGKRPFLGLTRKTILESLEQGPTAVKAEVPERVRDVLRVGLSIDPDERYPDMHALLEEFDKLLALDDAPLALDDTLLALDDAPESTSTSVDDVPEPTSTPAIDDAPELAPQESSDDGPSRAVLWSVFLTATVSGLLMMFGIFLWPEFIGLRSASEQPGLLPIPRPHVQEQLEAFKAVQADDGVRDVKSKIANGQLDEASDEWSRLRQARLMMQSPTALADVVVTTAFVEQSEKLATEGKMEAATKAAQEGRAWLLFARMSPEVDESPVPRMLEWRLDQVDPPPNAGG